MHGYSNKTKTITLRVSNTTYEQILKALNAQHNANTSVSDYARNAITHYAWRHNKQALDKELASINNSRLN